MFVTYKPEDGTPQEWVFNPARIKASEGQVLLREFGTISWDLFVQHVRQNDPHARRVLLWHLMRRQHPMLKFADVPDFYVDELQVEPSAAEVADLIETAKAAPLPADQKAAALAAFEAELELARRREEADPELVGKAPTPTSGTESTTGG